MENPLEKELESIGLNEKEAKVYLAGLELGPATAQELAAKATVARPSTYIAIESLTQKGLMSTFTKGKRKMFVAADPANVKLILDEQIEELEKKKAAIPSLSNKLAALSRLSSRKKSDVEMYSHVGGIAQLQQILLGYVVRGEADEILNFVNIDAARDFIPQRTMRPLWEELKKSNVPIRVIKTSSETESGTEDLKNWSSMQISKSEFPFRGELTVFGDRVSFISYEDEIQGLSIQNQDMADTLRDLFNLAWEKTKRKSD